MVNLFWMQPHIVWVAIKKVNEKREWGERERERERMSEMRNKTVNDV